MFKHQPGHISVMNNGHEINLIAILDIHVPMMLSVTSISVRSGQLNHDLEASAFKGTHFDFYLPSLQLVLCCVAAVKRLPVHQP